MKPATSRKRQGTQPHLASSGRDAAPDGRAVGLGDLGVEKGDRVALYMQNGPQFVIAMLATWRLGAIAVPCNPMLRERELAHHLADARVKILVALDELYDAVGRAAVEDTDVIVVTTSAEDLSGTALGAGGAPGVHDFLDLAGRHDVGDARFPVVSPDDLAVLTYTSGTTGPPRAR